MAVYFLDSSAVAKRYVAEPGMHWIRALCDPLAGNIIAIAQIAKVEVVSAFCSKARDQNPKTNITEAQRDQNIVRFRLDIQQTYSAVQISEDVYMRAADLCTRYSHYKLKALDALQLASALAFRDAAPVVNVACITADNDLSAAAQGEGFVTDNPLNHP